MIQCPNKSHPDWKKLVENTGSENEAYKEYIINEFNIPIDGEPSKGVKYMLKGVDILLSDKAKQIFDKGKKANWDLNKILTELAIPKEQKQLLIELGITDREQLALGLASNYSYTIEINTAKSNKYANVYNNPFDESEEVTADILEQNTPTQYYSNLTVPGGTNYTEQEIATPGITPSIKGHAQFATDKGIGWFRSDEQDSLKRKPAKSINEVPNKFTGVNNYTVTKTKDGWLIQHPNQKDELETNEKEILEIYNYGSQEYVSNSKTRRILEVQSDLFQKGRDRKDLVNVEKRDGTDEVLNYTKDNFWYFITGNKEYYKVKNEEKELKPLRNYRVPITKEEFESNIPKDSEKSKENQFLQLLNKDNNWVTFFVKSIIQDSAKNGYEKVLFPTGNTASKVEGHTTLEEFKKQKEERIKWLEQEKVKYFDSPLDSEESTKYGKTPTEIDNEINQLKQELERVETEGFGALKPVYKFYEIDVRNTLVKQYGEWINTEVLKAKYGKNWKEAALTWQELQDHVKSDTLKFITDECGNTWNEINLTEKELGTVLLQKSQHSLPFTEAIEEFKKKYNIKGNFRGMKEINKILKEARDNSKYDQILFGVESTPYENTITYNRKYPYQTELFQQQQAAQEAAPNMKLDTAVMNYFEAIGVKLSFVDQIYFNGKPIDANAKANALLQLVEVVEGKRQLDTLSEEAAHIWVEMAGGENNPMILKMMNDVTKYEIYQKVVAQYSEAYKGNVNLLKKEALGKVIASYMTQTVTGEPTLDNIAQSWFARLWTKIKSFFVGNKYKTASLEILSMTKEKADQMKKPSILEDVDMFQLNEETSETTENPIEEEENVHKTQYVFFKRRLAFLEAGLNQMSFNDPRYARYKTEIDELKLMFNEAKKEGDYKEIGERVLQNTENFIERLESNQIEITSEKLEDTLGVIEAFKDYPRLKDRSSELEARLFPFVFKLALDEINKYATEEIPITEEMINSQTEDVGTVVAGIGALANSGNYILRTIAAVTKAAQNRASVANKELTYDVQTQVDKLNAWGKQQGLTLEQVYELFYEERNDTLSLVAQKIDGKTNPKWTKIKNTPVLLNFFTWYQTETNKASKKLGITTNWAFIPNIKKKKGFIDKWKAEDLDTEEFQTSLSEELFADIVSNKAYKGKIAAKDKGTDLGEAILKFRAYGNKYEEMSQVLPKTRILQKMLEIKRTKSGEIVERTYTKATNKKTNVLGKNSNRWKMANDYIEMQVKGKMRKDEGAWGKAADQAMAYNSLLRIGLSPVTAVANVVFGDISNIIEGIGGQFYTLKDLNAASVIFTRETFDKDSKMNLILELLNPLQELSDYENISKIRIAKKYSPEKIKELMYSPQKIGEKWLQTRTMIAHMLNEKIKSIDGKSEISLWEVFEVATNENNKPYVKIKQGFEFSQRQTEKLTDKIQRLNEMIHGRYSSRDAANLSQNVLYRLVSQFRKWIPTQIENRMMIKQYDARLGVDIEGRYRTFGRLIYTDAIKNKQLGKAFYNLLMPLINSKKALEEGKLSKMEIYNMRKMMIEIILAAGSLLLFALASGGDDDDDKLKNPLVKFGLTLLNRASADLTFFYSAKEVNNLGKNAIPIAKLIGDVIDAVFIIPKVIITGETVIERGSNKGRYKIEKEIVDIVPILNPIFGQMRRIMSSNKLEELN